MNQLPRARGRVLTAVAAAIVSQAAAARAGMPPQEPASSVAISQEPAANVALPDAVASSAPTADEARHSTGGNVAELQRLIHASALTEFRTSYNGSYGASLLFYDKEMTYYIALFQQKNFWRVIKTQDPVRAEAIYAGLVRQTVQLSDIEIRRARLEAQKAFTDRMIALSRDRAVRLQADLNVARAQEAEVTTRQKQTAAQAQALNEQKTAAQTQLRELQRHIRNLQRQTEAGLPRSNPR